MAAEQRLVLEQLFGRESHSRGRGSSHTGLFDYRVCKSFLVGTCPHDLFAGSKENLGRCKKQHLERYKLLYESEKRSFEKRREKGEPENDEDRKIKRMIEDFEYEYIKDLEHHIKDVSRKIAMAENNLRHTPEEQKKIDQINENLDEMDARIGLLTQEIRLLNEKGHVSLALQQSKKQSELLEEREKMAKAVREITDRIGQASQQQLEVCTVCGAYLSRLDSDRRLADHFMGKVHMGYVIMRSELAEMKKRRGKV